MIVALDLGNTRVKWAVHPGGTPVADRILGSGAVAPEAIESLPGHWSAWGLPDEVVACSVAGSVAEAAVERMAHSLAVPLRLLRPVAQAGGVSNLYGAPASLGADRWAALVGARARVGPGVPALVVDAGTAMTVDALSADGRFLGGLIVPGHDLMCASLARGTARLPSASGRYVPFPRSTDDAIVSGALQAMAGAILRTRQAMLDAGEGAPALLLTGGSAPLLAPLLEGLAVRQVPLLVLEGVLVLAAEVRSDEAAGGSPEAAQRVAGGTR